MKTRASVMMAAAILLAQSGSLWAQTVFTITAAVPAATSVSIAASSITGTTWSTAGTALTFGTLTFDSSIPTGSTKPLNIWRAPNYFAIDISNNGGGSPSASFTYTEGSKPTGQVHGLGYKGTIDFKRVTINTAGVTTDNVITGHTKKALRDITVTESISSSLTAGGWLRAYIGLADGATGTPGEPFGATDLQGNYTGTLTITATTI